MQMIPIKMCKDCHPPELPKPRKSSIWDLPSNQRCAVIGTCLTLGELRYAAKRFKKFTAEHDLKTDYAVHSYFVSVSGSKNTISWYINKVLNHEHRHFIKSCQSLKTESQLLDCWRAIESSDMRSLSGYFWAMLSSKFSSVSVKDRIYGDIHMISHIAGQNHKLIRSRRSKEQMELRSELQKKDRMIDSKNRQIEVLNDEIRQLKKRLLSVSSQTLTNEKNEINKVLSIEKYKSKLDRQKQVISRLTQQVQRLSRPHERAIIEPAKTGTLTVDAIRERPCEGDCKDCKNSDLCGKKVLYVGGFSRHRVQFQKVTESINGQFFYHDGGLQQSEHQLDELVTKADVVFCPVDCISHNAMGRIKNLAKSQCKDCVFLKSASLSSFKNEISRYAS